MRLALLISAALLTASVASAGPAPRPAANSAADWRAPDPEYVLVFETSKGRIIAELTPQAAPQTVERIKTLARRGFYDGRGFFRVIDDFMAQTGDPTDTGTGGSDLPDLPSEFEYRRLPSDASYVSYGVVYGSDHGFIGALPVKSQTPALAALSADGRLASYGAFCAGVLGMARATARDSANSQFFFMRQDTRRLDRTYTAFGRVLDGLDVVRKINTGEPAPNMDKITSVKVLADLPEASRPKIRVVNPAGRWMKDQVGKLESGFDPCKVDIPVEVS